VAETDDDDVPCNLLAGLWAMDQIVDGPPVLNPVQMRAEARDGSVRCVVTHLINAETKLGDSLYRVTACRPSLTDVERRVSTEARDWEEVATKIRALLLVEPFTQTDAANAVWFLTCDVWRVVFPDDENG
jgi:hypothetical protein